MRRLLYSTVKAIVSLFTKRCPAASWLWRARTTVAVLARPETRLHRQLQQFMYLKVLILDEMGYLPMTPEEASLVLTSNKSFVEWGEIFNDQVLAMAILDSLLNHATTFKHQR